LDGDNENCAESNLVFLCLEHHDEYDSVPRLSKGLRQQEVKRWRDELYREMLYRFRSIRTRKADLSFVGFRWQRPSDHFYGRFRLKNTGDAELSKVVISIRLPDGVSGKIHFLPTAVWTVNPLQLWTAYEKREDFFEPGGRVCIKEFAPVAVLMPGHSDTFDALQFRLGTTKPGDSLELSYRIDAADMATVCGVITLAIPADPHEPLRAFSGEDEN
jgi:hypothetical protein